MEVKLTCRKDKPSLLPLFPLDEQMVPRLHKAITLEGSTASTCHGLSALTVPPRPSSSAPHASKRSVSLVHLMSLEEDEALLVEQ